MYLFANIAAEDTVAQTRLLAGVRCNRQVWDQVQVDAGPGAGRCRTRRLHVRAGAETNSARMF